jgi:acetyl-CoA carboxylase carboxyltransferase component
VGGRWAKTVVTGRARLHGIPLGVIVVETRTVEAVVPADPANPESQQQVLQQAGQVWYPDSAFKVRRGPSLRCTIPRPLAEQGHIVVVG